MLRSPLSEDSLHLRREIPDKRVFVFSYTFLWVGLLITLSFLFSGGSSSGTLTAGPFTVALITSILVVSGVYWARYRVNQLHIENDEWLYIDCLGRSTRFASSRDITDISFTFCPDYTGHCKIELGDKSLSIPQVMRGAFPLLRVIAQMVNSDQGPVDGKYYGGLPTQHRQMVAALSLTLIIITPVLAPLVKASDRGVFWGVMSIFCVVAGYLAIKLHTTYAILGRNSLVFHSFGEVRRVNAVAANLIYSRFENCDPIGITYEALIETTEGIERSIGKGD